MLPDTHQHCVQAALSVGVSSNSFLSDDSPRQYGLISSYTDLAIEHVQLSTRYAYPWSTIDRWVCVWSGGFWDEHRCRCGFCLTSLDHSWNDFEVSVPHVSRVSCGEFSVITSCTWHTVKHLMFAWDLFSRQLEIREITFYLFFKAKNRIYMYIHYYVY